MRVVLLHMMGDKTRNTELMLENKSGNLEFIKVDLLIAFHALETSVYV